MRIGFLLVLFFHLFSLSVQPSEFVIVFEDGITTSASGPLGSDVGARTEYHYLPEAAPRTRWIVSTFRWTLPPSWYIQTVDGYKAIVQRATNPDTFWHPMIVA